jgi:hypothetical protein
MLIASTCITFGGQQRNGQRADTAPAPGLCGPRAGRPPSRDSAAQAQHIGIIWKIKVRKNYSYRIKYWIYA